jgi:hypothetical protein
MPDERPRRGPGPVAKPGLGMVHLRVDPRERDLWMFVAERSRMSLSRFIREAMDDHIRRIFNVPCGFCGEPWNPHHQCERETERQEI